MRSTLTRLASGLCLMLLASSAVADTATVDETLKQAATEVSYLSFEKAYPLFGEAQRAAKEGSEQWQAAVFGQAAGKL